MSVYEFAHPIDKPIVNKNAIASQDPRVVDWDSQYLADTQAGGIKVALDVRRRHFMHPLADAALLDFIGYAANVPVRNNKSRIVEVSPTSLSPHNGRRAVTDINAQHATIIREVLERTNFGIIKLPLPWLHERSLESYMEEIERATAGEKAVVFDLDPQRIPWVTFSRHEEIPRRLLDSPAVGGVVLAGTPARQIYDSLGNVWASESIESPPTSWDNPFGEWHDSVEAAIRELPLAA